MSRRQIRRLLETDLSPERFAKRCMALWYKHPNGETWKPVESDDHGVYDGPGGKYRAELHEEADREYEGHERGPSHPLHQEYASWVERETGEPYNDFADHDPEKNWTAVDDNQYMYDTFLQETGRMRQTGDGEWEYAEDSVPSDAPMNPKLFRHWYVDDQYGDGEHEPEDHPDGYDPNLGVGFGAEHHSRIVDHYRDQPEDYGIDRRRGHAIAFHLAHNPGSEELISAAGQMLAESGEWGDNATQAVSAALNNDRYTLSSMTDNIPRMAGRRAGARAREELADALISKVDPQHHDYVLSQLFSPSEDGKDHFAADLAAFAAQVNAGPVLTPIILRYLIGHG